jgi:uncharacterized delta-60 repeat protein
MAHGSSPLRIAVVACLAVAIAIGPRSPVAAAPGELDPTFGAGGIVTLSNASTAAVAVQPDGRIVVGGTLGFVLARLESDGGLDTSFGAGGFVDDDAPGSHPGFSFLRASDLLLQPDGMILVAGHHVTPAILSIGYWGDTYFWSARFATTGTPDTTFSDDGAIRELFSPIRIFGPPAGGTFYRGYASALAAHADGRILVTGWDSTVRYHADGRRDDSFATDGRLYAVAGLDVVVTPGGAMVLEQTRLFRHDAGGDPDLGFGSGGLVANPLGPGSTASALARQVDGKIVVAGRAQGHFTLARLLTDGTLDPDFGSGGFAATPIGTASGAAALGIEADGTIVSGGFADTIDGRVLALAFHRPDGAPETSFGGGVVTVPVGAGDAAITDLALQPSGKIVASGSLAEGGAQSAIVARFEGPACGNGSLDPGEECDAGEANGSSTCCSQLCRLRLPTDVCRRAAVACDLEERCDGMVPTCPADRAQVEGGPCDDGNACTEDETCAGDVCGGGATMTCGACDACDPARGCVATPRAACHRPVVAGAARLLLDAGPTARRQRLVLKWTKGEATTADDLGDPLHDDVYALCLYDESRHPPMTILRALAPAGESCGGAPCWQVSKRGLRYRDPEASRDGLETILPRIGDTGRARIIVKGRGENLRLPALPLRLPVRVQLHAGDQACFEARFSADQFQGNVAGEFNGRSD